MIRAPVLVTLLICLAPAGLRAVGRDAEEAERQAGVDTASVLPVTSLPGPVPVPESIRLGLARDPDAWLDDLVLVLVDGLVDETSRVRELHDWVALSIAYDTSLLRSDSVPAQDCADVLRTGRSVCGGYSNLFERMCELAGVECVTIPGYARGERFRVLDEEDPTRANHAWNAVRLGGEWRLVDVTWDAGRILDDAYEQRYSADYLFVPPEQLIHTHFPEDPGWQLLDQPVTAVDFTRRPYLRAEFFRCGLELVTGLERVSRAGATAEFELSVPDDVTVFCRLLDSRGGRRGAEVFPERFGDRARFEVALPGPGEWVVAVYARPGPPVGRYNGVARFGFVRDPR
jgi:hypothetical protein